MTAAAILVKSPPPSRPSSISPDKIINIVDPVLILTHLFSGVPSACDDAGDFDDNETLDVTDALFGLSFLFRGGEIPPAPYPDPGEDPTDDGPLGCESGLVR